MKIKTLCRLISFVLILITSPALVSDSSAAGSGSDTAVDSISRNVLSYFTPVNGVVVSVENDRVSVKLSTDVTIHKGVRLSVFREGGPFYHPVTKEFLGKSEDYVGSIEVAEQSDDGLSCIIINGSIQPGDPVRITSSKIKLAFFQDRKANWAISELFYNTLKDSGRFDILEAYTSSYETDHLSGLARGLGADAVLMFSMPMKDGNKLLNAKLFWANDASILADISETAGSDIGEMIKPYEDFLVAAGAGHEPWGSYQLEKGQLIATGDVDGNGDNEFVVSDGNNLKIYNLKDELQEVWEIKGPTDAKHISIDIYDANRNGISEIFVTAIGGGDVSNTLTEEEIVSSKLAGSSMMDSYVIEYDPSSGYRIIADRLHYFFRAAGKTLLMQKYTSQQPFGSSVQEAVWEEGQYRPGRALNLPADVNIYGFSFVDWQANGQRYVMSFDDEGYLTMYDAQNNSIWKSSRTYGKSSMSFKNKSYSIANLIKTWSVRGRLVPIRTKRGQEIVVVNRVPMISSVPGLGTGEADVYSLWWDGSAMQEQLVLSDLSGTITDYLIEGPNLFLLAKGNMMSLAKNAVSGNFGKGSVLYYYSFGKK